MKSYLIMIGWFILLAPSLQAQIDTVILINQRPIEPGRYETIEGSPYVFEDFVLGSVFGTNAQSYDRISLNYNGYSKEFEVRSGDSYIELDKRGYMRVTIKAVDNPGIIARDIIFQKGFHEKFVQDFAELLFVGDHFLCVKEYDVNISEKVVQDVGKAVEFKRFLPDFKYYFIEGDDIQQIRLREKSIIKVMGHKKVIQGFLEQENVDVRNEEDFIELLRYLESEAF